MFCIKPNHWYIYMITTRQQIKRTSFHLVFVGVLLLETFKITQIQNILKSSFYIWYHNTGDSWFFQLQYTNNCIVRVHQTLLFSSAQLFPIWQLLFGGIYTFNIDSNTLKILRNKFNSYKHTFYTSVHITSVKIFNQCCHFFICQKRA